MDEKSIENLQPRLRIFILCDFHLRCGSSSALVGLTFKTTLKPRSSVMSVSSLPPICWRPRRGRCRGRRWWPHRATSWPGPALASGSCNKCKNAKSRPGILYRVQSGSVGSALACCKAGPSSNLDSAPHWADSCWRYGDGPRRMFWNEWCSTDVWIYL